MINKNVNDKELDSILKEIEDLLDFDKELEIKVQKITQKK